MGNVHVEEEASVFRSLSVWHCGDPGRVVGCPRLKAKGDTEARGTAKIVSLEPCLSCKGPGYERSRTRVRRTPSERRLFVTG